MTEDEINSLDAPSNFKKRKTVMDDYLNIIYKMLRDKVKAEVIMAYVVKKGYSGNLRTLDTYIDTLAKNNFNKRFGSAWIFYAYSYPDDVTVIRRSELLKYITTKNPKTKLNETVTKNFEIIKEKYHTVDFLKNLYDEFHEIIMGGVPDKLDLFVGKYNESVVKVFVDGIVNDINAVKNAIARTESNGFVEGNNNKFKLIKRILYGRANVDTLFKKCYFAFKSKSKDFNLTRLLKKDASD
jgi:hypothetical protein